MTHRRVIHMEVAADSADHDFPRMQPDADLHGHAMAALHLGGVLFHRGLHGQGRIAGPHCMVFMRQRCAKQRHDAVAHDLVDRALVAVHRGHHVFQDGIEELPGLLGIPLSQEFHGAFEVRKQHGHLLAFAFEGTAGGEDLLCQVGGCVGQRGTHGRLGDRCGGGRHRHPPPDQYPALFIHGQALAVNEFILEVFQGGVVKLKLPLEGAVGQPSATLEHSNRLV